MTRFFHKTILFFIAVFLLNSHIDAQCNVNTSICSNNAGPFTFVNQGPPVSTCLDFLWGNSVSYIMLYITQSGPLNLLISGNVAAGFLDVSIFNIPSGQAPCAAIQNNSNEISCNYATSAVGGCTQFGNSFPCASSVAAPNVNAGDVLMIVVENWSGFSTNYTLTLAPNGAQSGLPDATINPSGPFCVNSTQTQLTAVSMGGTWSGPGVSSTGLFNPATAGVGTHTINYAIGVAPCQATSSTLITVNPIPDVVASNDGPICSGLPVNLSATSSDSTASFSWSPGGLVGANVQATPASNSSYTVTATNQLNCTATAVTAVTVNSSLTISVNSPSICYGDSVQLTASGGTTYSWSTGQTGTSIYVKPITNETYTVNASAPNGCIGSAVSTVTVKPLPVLVANNVITCPGVSTVLNVNGANTYLWSDGQTGASISVPGDSLEYIVVGEIDGCKDSVEVKVDNYMLPDISFTVNNFIGCAPLTTGATIDYPSGLNNIEWIVDGSETFTNVDFSKVFNEIGCHDLKVVASSADGCVVQHSEVCAITVIAPPVADFSTDEGDVEVDKDVLFTDLSTSEGTIISWNWTFGTGDDSIEQNPVYKYTKLGDYFVTLMIKDDYGCEAEVTKSIKVVAEVIIYIPNSFTPNGDKRNDSFVLKGQGLESVTMTIFNRWGEPIITLEGDQPYTIGWDGTKDGKYLPQGVYVYIIELTDRTGKEHRYLGNINLFR